MGAGAGAITYLLAARLLGVQQLDRFLAALLGRD